MARSSAVMRNVIKPVSIRVAAGAFGGRNIRPSEHSDLEPSEI